MLCVSPSPSFITFASSGQVKNKYHALKSLYKAVKASIIKTGNDTSDGYVIDENGCLHFFKDGSSVKSFSYWSTLNDCLQVCLIEILLPFLSLFYSFHFLNSFKLEQSRNLGRRSFRPKQWPDWASPGQQ